MDVLARICIDQIKANATLDTLITDLETKAMADTRVKKFFSDKAQLCESKATAAELRLLEKEEQLQNSEAEAAEMNRRVRDLVQMESRLKFANAEFKTKVEVPQTDFTARVSAYPPLK